MLRKQLRNKRSIHPNWYRQRSATQAAQHLRASGLLTSHRIIASYIDVEQEFPTTIVNEAIVAHGQELMLPVITNYQAAEMRFTAWKFRTKFEINRYAIPEPIGTIQRLQLIEPDLILLPLLGFDLKGNRIGMGGGYYDRYLSKFTGNNTPRLIGLAFNNQQVESIPSEKFDIPIDCILTESGLQYFRR